MKLQKPFIGEYLMSQKFGENLVAFYKADGNKGHSGVDWAMPIGVPILSACDGQVIFISTDIHRGIGVTVLSDEIFKWNGKDCKLSTLYWHLKDKSVRVKVGDKVKVGQKLGLSGNTGRTTGPHLHFSVAPLSPDGLRKELAPNNGFNACIDPLPYLDLDTPKIKRIKELQELLNKHGAKLKVDGKYGPLSNLALNKFLA